MLSLEICDYLWRVATGLVPLLEATQLGRFRTSIEFWREFAEEYVQRARSRPEVEQYTAWQLSRVLPNCSRDSVVADLGCGFGRLAVPLAKHVKLVYAVDQCEQLLRHLLAYARQEEVVNKLQVLCMRWEDLRRIRLRPRPHVVVVSHSLEVERLSEGLRIIDELALTSAHLFVDVYPLLFRECYEAARELLGPLLDCIPSQAGIVYLALTVMRIEPEVELYTRVVRVPAAHLEEFLVRRFSHLLPLSNPEFRRRFVSEVRKRAQISDVVELRRVVAHIYWHKRC